MYELVISVGTIFFAILLWTILVYPLDKFVIAMKNSTPSIIFNETINKTALSAEYDFGYNIFYYSLFIIVFVVFIYVVKKAVEYQKKEVIYGG